VRHTPSTSHTHTHTHTRTRRLTGGHGELPLALQDELALVVHGGQHALLEEDDVVLLQAKVVVLREVLLGGRHRPTAGHDVPEGNTGEKKTQNIFKCSLEIFEMSVPVYKKTKPQAGETYKV